MRRLVNPYIDYVYLMHRLLYMGIYLLVFFKNQVPCVHKVTASCLAYWLWGPKYLKAPHAFLKQAHML